MKRAFALILAAALLALLLPLSSVAAHGNDRERGHGDKVTICRATGASPVTIRISRRALAAHMRLGDTLGACAPKPPTPASPTVCTFDAATSSFFAGVTNASALFATGPIHFSWTRATGAVSTTGGFWNDMTPLVSPVTFFNLVTGGTVSAAGAVTLSFNRTDPNVGTASFTGTLVGNVLSGLMSGTFFSATGTTRCTNGANRHADDQDENDDD